MSNNRQRHGYRVLSNWAASVTCTVTLRVLSSVRNVCAALGLCTAPGYGSISSYWTDPLLLTYTRHCDTGDYLAISLPWLSVERLREVDHRASDLQGIQIPSSEGTVR